MAKVYHMHDYLAAIAASVQNGTEAPGENSPAIPGPSHQAPAHSTRAFTILTVFLFIWP